MSFTEKTFGFLRDLEANNSKDWFDANRDRYETDWKEAALDVIASVSDRMAALHPPLRAEPKLNGSLRRINRDVRFSKDKTPYKARLHMVFWTGDHPNRSPGMHFVLSPEGVGYGAGQFGLTPEELRAMRQRIVSDGAGLEAALVRAADVGCRMGEPVLARVPKGFDSEGPRADLLRYKSFVARTHDDPAPKSKVLGAGAEDWMLEMTEALLPLIRWLHEK